MLVIARSSSTTRIVAFASVRLSLFMCVSGAPFQLADRRGRESNDETCAMRILFERQLAVVAGDNGLTHRQPHSRALAGILGCEKGVKNTLLNRLRHPWPGIFEI